MIFLCPFFRLDASMYTVFWNKVILAVGFCLGLWSCVWQKLPSVTCLLEFWANVMDGCQASMTFRRLQSLTGFESIRLVPQPQSWRYTRLPLLDQWTLWKSRSSTSAAVIFWGMLTLLCVSEVYFYTLLFSAALQ